MSKLSPIEQHHMNEAAASLVFAAYWMDRDDHDQAAFRFTMAADSFRRAGDGISAGYCERQATAERAMIRPSAPVNVSALVD